MTQTIHRAPVSLPPLLAALSRAPERAPGPGAAVLRGALAAGLGLGALAAPVTLLWANSPYPDGGIDGALRVAAALWLLAHGVELTRADTFSDVPVPVGVTPMLLAALVVWLAYRAGHDMARAPRDDRSTRAYRPAHPASTTGHPADRAAGPGVPPPGAPWSPEAHGPRRTHEPGVPVPRPPLARPAPWVFWCGVVLGYLLVAYAAARYADGGGLRPAWPGTAVRLPLLVAVAAAAGVRRAAGPLSRRRALARGKRASLLFPRLARRADAARSRAGAVRASGFGPGAPGAHRRLVTLVRGELRLLGADGAPGAVVQPSGRALTRRRLRATVRSAVAGTLVLLAGGALLALLSLLAHELAARTLFLRLGQDGFGRVALLVLVLTLLPNAAVWGAAFTLGPGFVVRTGHVLAPLGTAPVPYLPGSPALPVVPEEGYGAPASWMVGVVPLAAGLTIAWCTVQVAAPRYAERADLWSPARTALVAAGGAALCGLAVAVLSVLAGGPLGMRDLAHLGPVWWQTGAAATVCTLLTGLPAALLLLAWRRWTCRRP